uniref:Translation initiation factor 2 n=1 Tax=Streptomyces sp. NBC_00008 TaxID=2903610 RepID=A0AAU2VYL8_9ACTN
MPVGHDAHRWSTFHGERTLVVAARTVTSTVRVLETLPALLRGDTRVTVVFAYDDTSAFNAGVLDLLHTAGCRVAPWEQLAQMTPDLILSASENVDVPEGDCPVLVLPHGVGFQKFVPDSRSTSERLSGVVPDSLLESGRAWLAISHPAQEEQLLATHPKASGRTLLVGDPCFDELIGSRARRKAYREALGVADHQRLVMVSSTWGPTSLLGSEPDLLPRLLSQLPCDEARVGAIVHPNVWSAHGAWQLRTVQAAALDAGLLLMPAIHAWRPALVAADVLVGDHGSVTLYGAAAGTPLLLAAFGGDAVPGTAVHDLAAVAPRLDPRGDLRQQVEDVVRAHTPDRYAAVAARAFSEPGHALARLRTALYRLLKLPEPSSPPPAPLLLPDPDPPLAPITSWQVTTGVTGNSAAPAISVRRIPAAVTAYGRTPPDSATLFTHLACADDERDPRLTESASVIVRRQAAPTAVGALRWTEDTLAQLPGSLLAASATRGGGCLVGLRDGRVVETASTGPAPDPGLHAAVVYACLRAGLPLDDARVTLRIGDMRDEDVILRLRPAPPDR